MGLAKYFSKDLLAINQIINTDHTYLENKILSSLITIAFDDNAVNTFEGNMGLELIIRLLSRLYPKIKILDLSNKNDAKRVELINLSKDINSNIEISNEDAEEDVFILAGHSACNIKTKGLVQYFGSENWIAKYSTSKVQSFGDSENPFGCGVAACIVASNLFRYIFKNDLARFNLDEEIRFSAFSLSSSIDNPVLNEIKFDDVVIVGVGAIGNGAVWALSKLKDLKGNIDVVDHEDVDLTNLQRYVLLNEKNENEKKVLVVKRFFNQKDLCVSPIEGKWDNYIKNRNDWNINCVAVCIDNEKDRIGIQSSLPKIIFNSFTEQEIIGITRHKDFPNGACLACSHIPLIEKKNRINEIAENCNIPDKSELVKHYYNFPSPVNEIIPNLTQESLLDVIAKANKISLENLSQFNGKTIDQFYSDFVCGGVLLKLSQVKNEITNMDAPLAFQSALAGILLAAELVKHFMDSNLIQEPRTDFYPLVPIKNGVNPLHRIIKKDKTNRCICRDSIFINRYKEKWSNFDSKLESSI